MKQYDAVQLVIAELNRFAKCDIASLGGTVQRRWKFGDGSSYKDPEFKIKISETVLMTKQDAIKKAKTYFNSKSNEFKVIGPYKTDVHQAWKYKGQFFVDMAYGDEYHVWSPSKFKNPRHSLELTC